MIRLRHIFSVGILGIAALFGWSIYSYVFDTTQPFFIIRGIDAQASYAGIIECIVQADKKGEVTVLLDEKPLTEKFFIAAHDAYPLMIPTKTVANGQHCLRAEIVDTKFQKNRTVIERVF